MGKLMEYWKDILGIGNNTETELDERVNEKALEEAKIIKRNETTTTSIKVTEEEKKEEEKKIEKNIKINKELLSEGHQEEIGEEDTVNYQTIFIDPKTFNDCKKIAKYIKNDKMVTLNLEYLNSETAQRMMDFLMGAMIVKGASFIEISKKVYTAVPCNVKVHYEGKKNLNDNIYSGTSEE